MKLSELITDLVAILKSGDCETNIEEQVWEIEKKTNKHTLILLSQEEYEITGPWGPRVEGRCSYVSGEA